MITKWNEDRGYYGIWHENEDCWYIQAVDADQPVVDNLCKLLNAEAHFHSI